MTAAAGPVPLVVDQLGEGPTPGCQLPCGAASSQESPSQPPVGEAEGDYTVSALGSFEELNRCRDDWQRLLAATPGADFFYTLDWLEAYWQHFGERQQLRVLLVSRGGRPTGIVPLVIAPTRRFVGELRVLTYPLDWWGSFYGPIGPEPHETLRQALRWLQSQPRDWDLLELRFVRGGAASIDADGVIQPPVDPTDSDPTLAALHDAGFVAAKEPLLNCARISLAGTWEEYLATRRKSWRENIRRTEKKVAKAGVVEHLRYQPAGSAHGDDDPRWDLYDECLALAQQSWQGSSTDGHTLSHDNVSAFLKTAHAAAASAGCLDLNLLRIDGRAVAFHYGYTYGGYFSSLRLGFDPAVAKLGAGTVLTGRMIRGGFERGDHTFDFLPDCLKAKLAWQTSIDVGYRYSSYPNLLSRSQLVRFKNWFDRDVRGRSIVPS